LGNYAYRIILGVLARWSVPAEPEALLDESVEKFVIGIEVASKESFR